MLELFPELANADMKEMNMVKHYTKDLSDEEMKGFANIYRSQRKDPQTMLILCLVGLFVIPGVQRFFINQIGMGILYLFTIGLCFVGSIIDLVKYQDLALEYNSSIAQNILGLIKISGSKNSPETTD
jgi:TM2 domain-containing membrane protein YozV